MEDYSSAYEAVAGPIANLYLELFAIVTCVVTVALVVGIVKLRGRSKEHPYVLTALVGMASLILGYTFDITTLVTQGNFSYGYNTAILGHFGGLTCFLLATQQCLRADGSTPKYTAKATFISAVVCAAVCIASILVLDIPAGLVSSKVIYTIEIVLLGLIAFFNLRVALTPMEGKHAKSIRPFNFDVFLFGILYIVCIVLWFYVYDFGILKPVVVAAVAIYTITLVLIPFNLERGTR